MQDCILIRDVLYATQVCLHINVDQSKMVIDQKCSMPIYRLWHKNVIAYDFLSEIEINGKTVVQPEGRKQYMIALFSSE